MPQRSWLRCPPLSHWSVSASFPVTSLTRALQMCISERRTSSLLLCYRTEKPQTCCHCIADANNDAVARARHARCSIVTAHHRPDARGSLRPSKPIPASVDGAAVLAWLSSCIVKSRSGPPETMLPKRTVGLTEATQCISAGAKLRTGSH